jgi:hypothetical protein
VKQDWLHSVVQLHTMAMTTQSEKNRNLKMLSFFYYFNSRYKNKYKLKLKQAMQACQVI